MTLSSHLNLVKLRHGQIHQKNNYIKRFEIELI